VTRALWGFARLRLAARFAAAGDGRSLAGRRLSDRGVFVGSARLRLAARRLRRLARAIASRSRLKGFRGGGAFPDRRRGSAWCLCGVAWMRRCGLCRERLAAGNDAVVASLPTPSRDGSPCADLRRRVLRPETSPVPARGLGPSDTRPSRSLSRSPTLVGSSRVREGIPAYTRSHRRVRARRPRAHTISRRERDLGSPLRPSHEHDCTLRPRCSQNQAESLFASPAPR